MGEKKYIFILNNQGKGAILARPGQFGYPAKIAIPNKIPDAPASDKVYFNTGRIRYTSDVPTGEAMIYTERNCTLDLSKYEGVKPGKKAHDKPVKYGVTVSYTESAYVEVEAKTEEEAEELALQKIEEGDYEQSGQYDEPDYKFEVEEL